MTNTEHSYSTSIIFVEPRYWPDEGERQAAIEAVRQAISSVHDQSGTSLRTMTVQSEEDLDALRSSPAGVLGIFTPMSGAVQPWMLKAAGQFRAVAICGAYVDGFLPEHTGKLLLERNAAPAATDVFSVLKRDDRSVSFIRTLDSLAALRRAVHAVGRLNQSRVLQIGSTEPWVISSSRDLGVFAARLGMEIRQIDLKELYDVYYRTSEAEAKAIARDWVGRASAVVEPREDHVVSACRVTLAFRNLLATYKAEAVAIACFTLLNELGTTSCLALSELNTDPVFVGTCEGDLDAAATMILMKVLSGDAPWMGNPVVGQDNTIRLVHCTAPRSVRHERMPYALRSHHESGIGVSPEVELPVGEPVTLCRIGNSATAMSVFVGTAVDNPREPTCRTQLKISLPSVERFLQHALGNHQVLSYGDFSEPLRYVADILRLIHLN
jgi:L-fucose isomerase-like protein